MEFVTKQVQITRLVHRQNICAGKQACPAPWGQSRCFPTAHAIHLGSERVSLFPIHWQDRGSVPSPPLQGSAAGLRARGQQ